MSRWGSAWRVISPGPGSSRRSSGHGCRLRWRKQEFATGRRAGEGRGGFSRDGTAGPRSPRLEQRHAGRRSPALGRRDAQAAKLGPRAGPDALPPEIKRIVMLGTPDHTVSARPDDFDCARADVAGGRRGVCARGGSGGI